MHTYILTGLTVVIIGILTGCGGGGASVEFLQDQSVKGNDDEGDSKCLDCFSITGDGAFVNLSCLSQGGFPLDLTLDECIELTDGEVESRFLDVDFLGPIQE